MMASRHICFLLMCVALVCLISVAHGQQDNSGQSKDKGSFIGKVVKSLAHGIAYRAVEYVAELVEQGLLT